MTICVVLNKDGTILVKLEVKLTTWWCLCLQPVLCCGLLLSSLLLKKRGVLCPQTRVNRASSYTHNSNKIEKAYSS